MSRTITVDIFDAASIAKAAKELREYSKWIKGKADELAKRLAEYGLSRVRMGYAAAIYDGDKDIEVTVEDQGTNTYAIVASGTKVLFLEFGTGIKYGDGHPLNSEFGFGPGTYPGQTHVPQPGYWWYTGSDGESHYSVGNAPSMVMYITGMELRDEIENIAKEVFRP